MLHLKWIILINFCIISFSVYYIMTLTVWKNGKCRSSSSNGTVFQFLKYNCLTIICLWTMYVSPFKTILSVCILYWYSTWSLQCWLCFNFWVFYFLLITRCYASTLMSTVITNIRFYSLQLLTVKNWAENRFKAALVHTLPHFHKKWMQSAIERTAASTAYN